MAAGCFLRCSAQRPAGRKSCEITAIVVSIEAATSNGRVLPIRHDVCDADDPKSRWA